MPRKKKDALQTINERTESVLPKRLKMLVDEAKSEGKIPNQNAIAEYLGITRQSFTAYLNGTSKPDWETIVLLCKYFNVSADYLLGLSDIKSPDADIQTVVKVTGLSEEAVKELIKTKTNWSPDDAYRPINALSDLILDYNFHESLESLVTCIQEYFPFEEYKPIGEKQDLKNWLHGIPDIENVELCFLYSQQAKTVFSYAVDEVRERRMNEKYDLMVGDNPFPVNILSHQISRIIRESYGLEETTINDLFNLFESETEQGEE